MALAFVAAPSIAHVRSKTVLYQFAGGNDGAYPDASLVADQSGNLYGATLEGGRGCMHPGGCGTVFKVAPDGTETVVHAFSNEDGRDPDALLEDQQGNLFGVSNGLDGRGTVFEIAQPGTFTVLHRFARGERPDSLTADQAGNLYGTTRMGGIACVVSYYTCGSVFEVTSGGVYKTRHWFRGSSDGYYPTSLIVDTAGNLYGTTFEGGGSGCGGGGCTAFKISRDGETVLYAFQGGKHGGHPLGGMVQNPSGNLYGTTTYGGGECCGTVFEISLDGTETVLQAFDGTDGKSPQGALIRSAKGYLFGTTPYGGPSDCGTAFSLLPGHALDTPLFIPLRQRRRRPGRRIDS